MKVGNRSQSSDEHRAVEDHFERTVHWDVQQAVQRWNHIEQK